MRKSHAQYFAHIFFRYGVDIDKRTLYHEIQQHNSDRRTFLTILVPPSDTLTVVIRSQLSLAHFSAVFVKYLRHWYL